jgi:AAA15 family ATPase/GTPase
MLIRDLTIKGYRCFEDFSMDGLTRVNLLVGNNNSGKTSFLEAVYLLVNQPTSLEQKPTLFEILENRGEFKQIILSDPLKPQNLDANKLSLQYVFDYICHRTDNDEQSQSVTIKTGENRNISLLIRVSEPLSSFFFDEVDVEGKFTKQWNYSLNYKSEEFLNLFIRKKKDLKTVHPLSPETKFYKEPSININPCPIVFQTKHSVNNEKLFSTWDRITLTPKEDILIEALKILEPRIQRLGVTMSEIPKKVLVKLKNKSWPVPLNSMGDGMSRILTLTMALVSTEKGILLVDEIETGLHYEAQLDMWRLVFKTAQDLDVQVFATTHSWDCIAAFKEALQELEDQSVAKLFRLDSKYGKLRAVEYDAEEIRIAVNQGVEVR